MSIQEQLGKVAFETFRDNSYMGTVQWEQLPINSKDIWIKTAEAVVSKNEDRHASH